MFGRRKALIGYLVYMLATRLAKRVVRRKTASLASRAQSLPSRAPSLPSLPSRSERPGLRLPLAGIAAALAAAAAVVALLRRRRRDEEV